MTSLCAEAKTALSDWSCEIAVDGYTVKVDIYGGTKDVNVAVVITIFDNYMHKAWGMSPKI